MLICGDVAREVGWRVVIGYDCLRLDVYMLC